MRSAVVLGGAAWLLGAASATAASIYAVGQLGTGILSSPGPGSSVAEVLTLPREPSEPAKGRSAPDRAAGVVRGGTGRPAQRGGQQAAAQVSRDVSNAAGDGGIAICQRGLASLEAVTPAQGVATGDLQLGPAPVARVTFSAQGSAVVLQVSCVAGKPSVQWLQLPPPGGGQGGDE